MQDYITRIRAGKTPLVSKQKLIPWLITAASALSFLHSRGIAHANLSPENVLLDPRPNVLKLDNYVALLPSRSSVGEFRSPERIKTAVPTVGDDVWALGCLAYYLCTLQARILMGDG